MLKDFFIEGDDVDNSSCDPFVCGWLIPVVEDGMPKNSVTLEVREVEVPFTYMCKVFLKSETVNVKANVWQIYHSDTQDAKAESMKD